MFIEMFFISSIMLLCRSCSVGEIIVFFNAAMLSPNTLILLKEHGINKHLIYFKARYSAYSSPWKLCLSLTYSRFLDQGMNTFLSFNCSTEWYTQCHL